MDSERWMLLMCYRKNMAQKTGLSPVILADQMDDISFPTRWWVCGTGCRSEHRSPSHRPATSALSPTTYPFPSCPLHRKLTHGL